MRPTESKLELHHPAYYRIRVQGKLDASWTDYFAGMTICCPTTIGDHAVTILSGQLLDQAMLLGVLNSLYNLGLPLLSVEYLVEGALG